MASTIDIGLFLRNQRIQNYHFTTAEGIDFIDDPNQLIDASELHIYSKPSHQLPHFSFDSILGYVIWLCLGDKSYRMAATISLDQANPRRLYISPLSTDHEICESVSKLIQQNYNLNVHVSL